ncbi:hypothetical protein LM6186_90136 [Listeria monocytogenes]|nr:protein of unknown function [Listeria monocytogenes R479a]CDN69422.1 hypothetical protein LM4423_60068 [Listeria monocytogenes 4423]CUK38494.1 hypothetical protein LM500065_80764 [Listeria monocytogenes]CUK47605.1 hypothetical protein LM500401_70147 [Listeria monocytogenes]CUK48354.1 hypothetical protein LM57179_110135 [Listeria monocytogenes]
MYKKFGMKYLQKKFTLPDLGHFHFGVVYTIRLLKIKLAGGSMCF